MPNTSHAIEQGSGLQRTKNPPPAMKLSGACTLNRNDSPGLERAERPRARLPEVDLVEGRLGGEEAEPLAVRHGHEGVHGGSLHLRRREEGPSGHRDGARSSTRTFASGARNAGSRPASFGA
jgi:hypothetical protein